MNARVLLPALAALSIFAWLPLTAVAGSDDLFPVTAPSPHDLGLDEAPLAPIALADSRADEGQSNIIDLSTVPVGSVLGVGSMRTDGLCTFDGPLMGVQMPERNGWVFSFAVDDDCQLILSESCYGLDCAVTTDETLGAASPPPSTAAAAGTCTGSRTGTVTVWTLGYGGSGDVLTKNTLTITFTHHCTGVNPSITYISGTCYWASWNNWKKDQCYYYQNAGPTTCGTCGPGVQYGLHGDYHCDFNGNFCSFTDWRHTLLSSIDGYNDGNAWCTWAFNGNVPPSGHYDSNFNKKTCVG
jgi:hypothetical protein